MSGPLAIIRGFLARNYLGNSLWQYILAAAAFVLTLGFLLVLRRFLRKRFPGRDPAASSLHLMLSLIPRVYTVSLVALALEHALSYVAMEPHVLRLIQFFLLTVLVIQVLVLAGQFLGIVVPRYLFPGPAADPARANVVMNIVALLKAVLWVGGLLFLLDNLGFSVTSVVAGLGIGGIALALASQKILGDAFSSFTIYLDRPFEVGDFIVVGEFMGAVENIGLKTTRLRSLGGELLVFSNSDLTSSRIRNYQKMRTRRVEFRIGVVYDTSLDRLKQIPHILREAVEQTPDTRFDRAHFKEYAEYALVHEVVYYVLSADYNLYMDRQQGINLRIRERFDELGIQLAHRAIPLELLER